MSIAIRFAVFFLAALLTYGPVAAQYQVPSHAVPVGRGAGVTGFGSAAPGVAGLPLVGNGTSSDPSFKALPNSGLTIGPAGSVKGSADGVTETDSIWTDFVTASCTVTPSLCSALFGHLRPAWYGAKCDGVTHDEVAFQNALNAANSSGYALVVPRGVCLLNADITNGTGLFTNTLIMGYGNTSGITFLGNHGFAFNATAGYYVMQDLTITCASTSASPCIKVYNASQSTAIGSIFQRLYVPSFGAYGMYFQNLVQARVINNALTPASTSSIGIFVDNTQTADVGGNMIKDNHILNVASGGPAIDGISLLNVGGTQIIGNEIDGFINDILSLNTITSGASTGLQIQNNQLDDFTTAGISLNSSGLGGSQAHVNISGNVLHALQTSSANAGIIIGEAPGSPQWMFSLVIAGNQVDTVLGNVGILVAGTGGYTVSGNLVSDDGGSPASPGIVLTASGTICTVVGNAIKQYTTHVSNSAGCAVSGNN